MTCSFGLSYRNLLGSVLVFGVAIHDEPTTSPAQKSAVRAAGRDAHSRASFDRACEAVSKGLLGVRQQKQSEVDVRLDEIRDDSNYLNELAGRLSPQIQQAMGQLHDYRALAGRVLRNISVYLEGRAPGKGLVDQLDVAPYEIVAAHWSAVLMIDKLDTALFLLNPDQILATLDDPFRFHGLATKYSRIYEHDFKAKSLRFVPIGDSRGFIHSNSIAIAVFPLNFLDNAVKYAPAHSAVTAYFEETSEVITYSVESLGPLIRDDERRRIFEPFYRGEAARAASAEGMGFGLAVCRLVAEKLGTRVNVWQDSDSSDGRFYRTRFTVELPRRRE